MTGTPVLVALGDFLGDPGPSPLPQGSPVHAQVRGDDGALVSAGQQPSSRPGECQGYGAAILDNYLFIVGGYRITSQEISAGKTFLQPQHQRVAPGGASMNQKR